MLEFKGLLFVLLLLSCDTQVDSENIPIRDYTPGHICITSPCKNIGKCMEKGTGFWCDCYKQLYEPNTPEGGCDPKYPVEKNYCSSNPCVSGECRPVWGGYFCECKHGIIGKNCGFRSRGVSKMSKPTFVYNVESFTQQYSPFLLYFETPYLGDAIQMKVDTGEGVVLEANELNFIRRTPSSYSNEFINSSVIHRKLQALNNETAVYFFRHKYTSKDKDLTISVTLNNSDTVQFRAFYPIQVSRPKENCEPRIEFSHLCANHSVNSPKLYRRVRYVVWAHIRRRCFKYGSYLNYSWRIYNVTDGSSEYQRGMKPMKFNDSKPSANAFFIPPFSLHFGVYALKLRVNETVGYVLDGGKQSYFKERTCYLHVAARKPTALIQGGHERKEGINRPHIFNGLFSFDTNVERKDKYQDVNKEWKCISNKPKGDDVDDCMNTTDFQHSTYDAVRTLPKKTLALNYQHNFTLNVSVPGNKLTDTFIQSATYGPEIKSIMDITTLIGCEDYSWIQNPAETVIWKAYCFDCDEKKYLYEWTLSDSSGNVFNTSSSYLFTVKNGTFQLGESYTLTVTGKNNVTAEERCSYTWNLKVNNGPKKGSCDIRHRTESFEIKKYTFVCEKFKDENHGRNGEWPLLYTIIQTININRVQTIVSQTMHVHLWDLQDIFLCESMDGGDTNVTVVVTDVFGGSIVAHQQMIKVDPMFGDKKDVGKLIHFINGTNTSDTLPNLFAEGDMEGATLLLNALSVAIRKVTNTDLQHDLRISILRALDKIPVYSLQEVSTMLVSLHTALNYEKKRNINIEEALIASKIASRVAKYSVTFTKDWGYDTSKNWREINIYDWWRKIQYLMEIDPKLPGPDHILDKGTIDYPVYWDVGDEVTNVARQYEEYAVNMINALIDSVKSLLPHFIIEEEELVLDSRHKLTIKGFRSANHTEFPENSNQTNSIKLSDTLAQDIDYKFSNDSIFAYMKTSEGFNPLWWSSTHRYFKTQFVGVFISAGSYYTSNLEQLIEPIDIYSVTKLETDPVTETMNLEIDEDNFILDSTIPVYRVSVKKGEILWVNFTSISIHLQAVIQPHFRPIIDDFNLKSTFSISPSYMIKYDPQVTVDDTWVYIGILPKDLKEPFNSSRTFTTSYTFSVNRAICERWSTKNKRVVTHICEVGEHSTWEVMHCRSKHLSLFTGSLHPAPVMSVPFSDVPFILKVEENVTILICMCIFLLIFLLLFLWAWRKDRRDYIQRKVIILRDNVAGELYPYLIAVYTGARKHSGTTSKVGIRLVGTIAKSKPHILNDSSEICLQRNGVDWFVLFTHASLGDLLYVELWHDNSGHTPAWYCNDIVVRDVQTRALSIFLVNRWLSVVRGEGKVHYTIPVATQKELNAFKYRFTIKCTAAFREYYLWITCFFRNPLNNFTRRQRVAVFTCSIMLIMFINTLFYGLPRGTAADLAEDSRYSITRESIMYGFLSVLIVLPITLIIVLLFRKARPSSVRRAQEEAIKLNAIIADELKDIRKGQGPSGDEEYQRISAEGTGSPKALCSWCRYVAWVLCIICIVVSVTIIAMYSIHYGRIRTLMWFTSVVTAILASILIVEPIKCLVIALFNTFYLKSQPRALDLDKGIPLDLDICEERTRVRKSQIFLNFYRTLPKYQPLSMRAIEHIRCKEIRRLLMPSLIFDVFLWVIYMILLVCVILSGRHQLSYYSTRHIKNMLIDAHYGGDVTFNDIQDYRGFYRYMKETFTPAIHAEKWYGNTSITKYSGWTADHNCRLVGIPRLRQLRVVNKKCLPQELNSYMTKCSEEYSKDQEDQKDYGHQWGPFSTLTITGRTDWPWIYQTASESESWHLYGKVASYPGGGYVLNLGRHVFNSLLLLDYFDYWKWIDELTRMVVIDVTLYNADSNLFNYVTLLVEISAAGTYVTSYKIHTVTLMPTHYYWNYFQLCCFVVFVIISVLLFVNQLSILGKYNFRDYSSSMWTLIDLAVILLGLLYLSLYCAKSYHLSIVLRKLDDSHADEFIDFYMVCHLELALQYVIGFIIFLVTIRCIRILYMFQAFRKFDMTLSLAGRSLLSATIISMLMFVLLSIVGHVLLGNKYYNFSSFILSLCSFLSMALGFHFEQLNYKIFTEDIVGVLLFLAVCVVVIFLVFNLFISVLLLYYNTANWRVAKTVYKYGMIDYIRDEFIYHLGIRSKNKARLCGGADDMLTEPVKHRKGKDKVSPLKMEAMRLLTLDELKQSQNPKENMEEVVSDEKMKAMEALTLDLYTEINKNL